MAEVWNCEACGGMNVADASDCYRCGQLRPDLRAKVRATTLAELVEYGQPTVIRAYRAKFYDDALAEFEEEAEYLASHGYQPITQLWVPGQWACGQWAIVFVLLFVLVGFLALLYMLLNRPPGTLTVTFALRPDGPAPAEDGGSPSLTARLRDLREALDAGLITGEEYATKRAGILDAS